MLYCSGIFEGCLARERRHDPREHVVRRVCDSISPSGGGLLNENGLNVAEQMSTWGTDPAVLNGLVGSPSWLTWG